MKYFLNAVLGAMFSTMIIDAGVAPVTSTFWLLFLVFVAAIAVQYIDR